MPDTSKGKIFPASERGHTETDWFRSYNTFHFGQYRNEHKAPFGSLYVLNDDTLAGDKSFNISTEEDSVIILLPVVGAIAYKDSNSHENLIEAGQVQACATPKGTTLTIHNPYEQELINFLQLWHRHPSVTTSLPETFSFDLKSRMNTLLPLLPSGSPDDKSAATYPALHIGMFNGRSEGIYHLCEPGNGVFVFIVQGAFEVQNRLLETRDGLGLWDVDTIEFEALSNDAIILLQEVALTVRPA